MPAIQENYEALRQEFAELEDGFERYAYLVELAAFLPQYPEDYRTPEYLVQGCQSRVWLHPFAREGRFFFDADSDTLIIKGALLVLHDLLNGVALREAAEAELNIFRDLGLAGIFSDTRQKGIRSAIEVLQRAAETLEQGQTVAADE